MATYRVLRGTHHEKDEDGVTRSYPRGAYVITDTPLEQRFGSAKFRKISDDDLEEKVAKSEDPTRPPRDPKPINDGLDNMTVDQLRELADEEEVDLSGAKNKAEIIKRIRAAE